MKPLKKLLLLTFAVVPVTSACDFFNPFGTDKNSESSELSDADTVSKYWLSKTTRLLRGGAELNQSDDTAALLTMSRDEVMDKLMADSRFGDMVLDFNLYFLGFKPDQIRNPAFFGSPYARGIFAKPQAITSAVNTMNGGDYLSLFDLKAPRYVTGNQFAPFKDSLPDYFKTGYPDNADVLTQRKFILDAVSNESKLITKVFSEVLAGTKPLEDACSENEEKLTDTQTALFIAGIPDVLANFIAEGLDQISISCFLKTQVSAEAVARVNTLPDRVAAVVPNLSKIEPENYKINSLLDLQTMAGLGISTTEAPNFTVEGFWEHFQNSSTNYNRRRAAYMLRTYFCDDLTPINIAVNSNMAMHTENKHASDPGCRGCHYKLDPMAGFFRDYGVSGITNFGKPKMLVFDDMARVEADEFDRYMDSWRADPQSGRTWEAGYIRNVSKPSRNAYGESLDDLMKIIKTAPEAKACLVRRMAEYTLGTEQLFDQAWLDELTKHFSTEQNSGTAFKKILRELLKSKTYATRDPDPNACYDQVGDPATFAVPCAVRSIINKHCAACHANTDDTPLNLTEWLATAGSGGSFPHVDGNGTQLDVIKSMTRIKARLESRDPDDSNPLNSDPGMQMPPGGGKITDPEKQILFKWLEQRINGTGG